MKPIKKKQAFCTSSLFIVLCSAALVYHVSEISKTYFDYSTSSRLTLTTPKTLTVPSLSLCWSYAYIIDEVRLRQELELPVAGQGQVGHEYRQFLMGHISMDQLFRLTPQRDATLKKCIIRFPGTKRVEHYEDTCNSRFKVLKFYTREHICYRMELIASGEYDFKSVSDAATYSAMTYMVTMSSAFDKGQYLFPVIHEVDSFPSDSIRYSGLVGREINSTSGLPKSYAYYASYSLVKINYMPLPYDTKCFNYREIGFSTQKHCYTRCLILGTIRSFRKFPSSEMLSEDMSYNRSMGHLDARNMSESNYKELQRLENECNAKCSKPDCEESRTITQTRSQIKTFDVTFRLDLPRFTSFSVTFIPTMLFSEFLLYVMSCIGTYLGVALVHLNPLKLIANCKQAKSNRVAHLQVSAPDALFKHLELAAKCEKLDRRLKRVEARFASNH